MSIQPPRSCFFQAVSPPESAYDESILVHLIDDDSSVSVLRDTLTFHSGHFAKLFEDDPDRRIIVVPEISAHLFSIIERWLCTGIALPKVGRLSYADAVTIYNFGDTYAMPRLRNAVVDLVFATIFDDQLFPLSALNDVYNRTRPCCPLRKLLVDIAISVYNWEDLMLKSELLPKEFLLEVIEALRGKTVRLGVTMFPVEVWHRTIMEPLCSWHEHIEPNRYSSEDAEPEEPKTVRFNSEDCELEILDYAEPEKQEANECWHSALVVRTR